MLTLSLIDLIVLAAATWYISYIVSSPNIKGPWGILELIRLYFPLGGLTTCIICLSVWVAFVLCMLSGDNNLIDTCAVAGVSLWFHAYTGWKFNG